jgi:iron complex outermembrane receptor protein
VGLDIDPPVVPGLRIGGSYYNLEITDLIAATGLPQNIPIQFPQFIYCHSTVAGQLGAPSNSPAANCNVPLSPAEVAKYLAAGSAQSLVSFGFVPGGSNADLLTGARQVPYVMDLRNRNIGGVQVKGIDFSVSYQLKTRWGAVDSAISGNYQLDGKQDTGPGTLKTDLLEFDAPRWRSSTRLGTNWNGVRAQVTWLHTASYALRSTSSGSPGTATAPCVAACGQARVSAFDTYDLMFRYDFKGGAIMKDLSATLNLQGFANGFTVGRFIQLGLAKQF